MFDVSPQIKTVLPRADEGHSQVVIEVIVKDSLGAESSQKLEITMTPI